MKSFITRRNVKLVEEIVLYFLDFDKNKSLCKSFHLQLHKFRINNQSGHRIEHRRGLYIVFKSLARH